MRKFIVKNYVLNSITILFGKQVSWVRAANWIWPNMCIGGFYSIYTDKDFMNPMGLIILALLLVQILIVTIYFIYKPAKWDEMDLEQKWQYKGAFQSQQLTKPLPQEEVFKILEEGQEIDKQFMAKYKGKRFYNVGTFLVNPILMILTLIFSLIILA